MEGVFLNLLLGESGLIKDILAMLKKKKGERITEKELLQRLDPGKLPQHVAIIMDGNGRWAQAKGMPRGMGHRMGMEALREAVRVCAELGIKVLTVYAFSTENWKRPREEVNFLMDLLYEYVQRELNELDRQGVQIRAIGHIEDLPERAQKELARAQAATRDNRKLILNIALNYGGRTEIVDAARHLAEEVATGKLRPGEIDENRFRNYLYTADLPDPDLLIRPAGEMRVSNFLLWQLAYTEFWLTKTFWPDFNRNVFLQALLDYQDRERRFGGL